MIEMLINVLKTVEDKNTKAVILQSYIAEFGAVPDEYGDLIRELLGDES